MSLCALLAGVSPSILLARAPLAHALGAPPAASVPPSAALGRARPASGAARRRAKPVLHAPAEAPLSVSTAGPEPAPAVPADFLGLSFEVAALPQLAGYAHTGDLLALLRSLGPGVVRFGGVTADEDIGWLGAGSGPPAWASGVLDAPELGELGALAAQSGWHVLLTIGLGHYEPQAAAEEAAAAKAELGESLEAIELGNEPDSYARHGLRAQPWSSVQYEEQVTAYREAIDALTPGLPLAGPDSSGSSAYETWGLAEAIEQQPALLTGHHYPLGCNEDPPPSIVRLLSPRVRRRAESSLARYLAVSRQSGIPFRMDETNTVSCGGMPGISDTFASALWALSYITRAMSMGAAGINLQGNPDNCDGYTPLCASSAAAAAAGELRAQPEWYALLMAHALVGERPLAARLFSPEHTNVTATAFQARDGARQFVLVDDDLPGERHAAVTLRVGAGFHGGSVLTLSAPSPEALAGVRLGGREVAPDGLWSAPAQLPRVPNRDGRITVSLAPSSAALVTVSPLHPPASQADTSDAGTP